MNFLDSAIALLEKNGKALAVEQLCALAVKKKLLDKPGKNPLRSMKTRLSVELKKGSKSRITKSKDELWSLKKTKAKAKTPKKKATEKKAAAKTTTKAKVKTTTKAKPKVVAKAKTTKTKPKVVAKAKATKTKPKVVAKAKATKANPKVVAKAKATKANSKVVAKAKATKAKPKVAKNPIVGTKAKAKAPVAEKKSALKAASANIKDKKTDIKKATFVEKEKKKASKEIEDPKVVLSAEEKELVKLYDVDSQGTQSVTALNEYKDGQTQDEDRLMLPEIKAERKSYKRERGGRDKTRRSGREENKERSSYSQRRNEEQSKRQRDRGARDLRGNVISVQSAAGVGRERLTRLALRILSELSVGHKMPVRQLTQTMIRRKLLVGDANSLWRMVKGTLLVSEQRRVARGLVPLVRYHGKDLFSAGQAPGRSIIEVAAATLQKAAEDYAAAVERETMLRLANLAPTMLERIVYIYMQSNGWTEIQWVKRVGKSSYAVATGPGAVDQTMVAVRTGPETIDRRGIGELRAGLHAKGIASGLLISPCEMSDTADEELAKEGSPVRILCGKSFIAELIAKEVGVTWSHWQLPQLDQRFFDAILS